MKKNIFKFTYIAVAIVSMIALGQRRAYAANDCVSECAYSCEVTDGTCTAGCVGSGDDSCVGSCQSADADCKDGCIAQCGGPVPQQ
jgi:hypothetical protein